MADARETLALEPQDCLNVPTRTVSDIVADCLAWRRPSDEDVRILLEAEDDECDFQAIMQAARELREGSFGKHVYLYGFVYFSTYCRNNCSFCYYAASNDEPPRYRKSIDEAVAIAKELADSGVHLIDLTMGEDPLFLDDATVLPELVARVHGETGLPIMLSPGVLDQTALESVHASGATWYALYQETFDSKRFADLRCGQSAAGRLKAKIGARRAGMLIEEGLMCGLGETREELANSLCSMRALDPDQVRVMTFVPQEGTPLSSRTEETDRRELLLIGIMRLLFPDMLIPASLDVEGAGGLQARLNAGANVITSIIPPDRGLAGVANAYEGIADGSRTVAGVTALVEELGLSVAPLREYRTWTEARLCHAF